MRWAEFELALHAVSRDAHYHYWFVALTFFSKPTNLRPRQNGINHVRYSNDDAPPRTHSSTYLSSILINKHRWAYHTEQCGGMHVTGIRGYRYMYVTYIHSYTISCGNQESLLFLPSSLNLESTNKIVTVFEDTFKINQDLGELGDTTVRTSSILTKIVCDNVFTMNENQGWVWCRGRYPVLGHLLP